MCNIRTCMYVIICMFDYVYIHRYVHVVCQPVCLHSKHVLVHLYICAHDTVCLAYVPHIYWRELNIYIYIYVYIYICIYTHIYVYVNIYLKQTHDYFNTFNILSWSFVGQTSEAQAEWTRLESDSGVECGQATHQSFDLKTKASSCGRAIVWK